MKNDNPFGLSDQAVSMLARAGINPFGMLRVNELKPRLGVPYGISTIWKKCAETPPAFPLPCREPGLTAWRVGDVMAWLEKKGITDPAVTYTRGERLTAARQKKRKEQAAPQDLAWRD
ncbi:MAG: hypothetical protein V5B39_16150 [Accumulibacter sp.]|jgi:predicted DNA-binding transcriptional regulator AlpA|uniref:helix-turn-helix transcriptional regulator n=1 Tax=Accumulibacter sp. TaxID=2053492 RepID=UPI002FC319F2